METVPKDEKRFAFKVSVIIPVYNVETYLDECVQSVVKQTCPEIEIILVDDGSKDSSGRMCDVYASEDQRIKVIHKKNGGLGSARNAGLEMAQGKYFLFLDSDDYLDLNCVEYLFDIAEKNKLDMVLFTAESFIDGVLPEESVIGDYQTYKDHLYEVMSGVDCLEYSIHNKDYIVSNCMRLYSRRIATFHYNEEIVHEDEDIGIYTYLLSKRVMRVDLPFYKRRYRAGSIMTSTDPAREANGYMYAAVRMIEFYTNTKSERMKKILLERFESYFHTICEKYLDSTPDQKMEISDAIRRELFHLQYIKLPLSKKTKIKILFPWVIEVGALNRLRPFVKEQAELIPDIRNTLFDMLNKKGHKIYLLGTPVHGNYGDHIIALSEIDFLKRHFRNWKVLELPMPFILKNIALLKRHANPEDIICISGGGWLGSKWKYSEDFVRKIIVTFRNNPIVIFPQTVFYEDGDDDYARRGAEIYSSHTNLLFCLRERASYDYVIKHGFVQEDHAFLMPDFALLFRGYNAVDNKGQKCSMDKPRKDVIKICFRNDVEKITSKEQTENLRHSVDSIANAEELETNITPKNIATSNRRKAVADKLREVAEGKLLVTDRLHAMLFAAITETPCLALDNATHKVKGVYEWVRDLDYIKMSDDYSGTEEELIYLYNIKPQKRYLSLDFTAYEEGLFERMQDLMQ